MNQFRTTPICWSEDYSVGVDVLDRHHQRVAVLINQLADRLDDNIKSEKMVDILTALVNYAEYHFRHEEGLMAEARYDDLESHQLEHRQFCEIIAETCYGATLGIVGVKELFSYLTRWWKNHILLEDMKYRPYLASNEETEPA